MSDDFDWKDDDSVVLRSQPATAVYTSTRGMIVIRREADFTEQEDSFIFIEPGNVLAFVGAILEAAGMDDVRLYRQDGFGCTDIDLSPTAIPDMRTDAETVEPKAKDKTAAERQRRRRRKQRDTAVTPDRDTVTITRDELPLRLVV